MCVCLCACVRVCVCVCVCVRLYIHSHTFIQSFQTECPYTCAHTRARASAVPPPTTSAPQPTPTERVCLLRRETRNSKRIIIARNRRNVDVESTHEI